MTPDCRLCLVLSLLWEVYSSMFSGFSPFFKNQQLFPKLVILSYLLVFSPYRWHQKEKEPLMEDGQAAIRWEFRLDSEVISSSTSEQSNKRTGSRLKTESVRLLRYSYIRYAKPILRKKKTDYFAVSYWWVARNCVYERAGVSEGLFPFTHHPLLYLNALLALKFLSSDNICFYGQVYKLLSFFLTFLLVSTWHKVVQKLTSRERQLCVACFRYYFVTPHPMCLAFFNP